MKHTPGPWTHKYGQIMAKPEDSDTPIGIADVKNRNMDANARLIAAAPDLLEACKAVYADQTAGYERYYLNEEAFNKVKVAIAKAE